MARFYAAFDNEGITALEAINASNCYQRVAISNGSTLKSALVSTRSALSSAALAQMDAANRDGSLGIVVPRDAVTRSGGNYSWSNLYTNSGAVWPSDPRIRPTSEILIAGSTPVSPTDAGTIDESLYTNAQTAVENVLSAMTGGGPRGRIGLNPFRTMASIWHDHDLTFFAWDDFTPGAVIGLNASSIGGATDLQVIIFWTNYEYPNDQNPNSRLKVYARLDRQEDSGATNYVFESDTIVPPDAPREVLWNVGTSGSPVANGNYSLVVQVEVRDAVITTHFGAMAQINRPANEFDPPFVTIGI
jgi:hypothetical protein